MDGLLVLDKPPGWTSHDAVALSRRLLGTRQVGHLGTLDPLATGVLPLAVGAATRLIEFTRFDKRYEAVCLLGKTTDSADVSGKVLHEMTCPELDPEKVREALRTLSAVTEQIPPMVSAVKQGGKKLYELAREGKVVERAPRPVQITGVELLYLAGPRVTFRVTCSAGTYVRTLCETLGSALGVGGCLEALRRTRSGPFELSQSVTMDDLKREGAAGRGESLLQASSRLVEHLSAVTLPEEFLKKLCQGQAQSGVVGPTGWLRVLNGDGRLCAVAEHTGDILQPQKVFGPEGIA